MDHSTPLKIKYLICLIFKEKNKLLVPEQKLMIFFLAIHAEFYRRNKFRSAKKWVKMINYN